MTNCKAVASNSTGGERERLPGVPHVVQAISIGSIAVLPRLTPRYGGEDKYEATRRSASRRHRFDRADRALFRHVRRRTIMIQSIRPLLQAAREEMKFGRMQIPGGRIHTQRILVSSRWHSLRRTN